VVVKLRKAKKITYPTVKRITCDFLAEDEKLAVCAGFIQKDNKLLSGLGASVKSERLTPPVGVSKAYYSQGNGGLFLVAGGKVYLKYKPSNNFNEIYTIPDGASIDDLFFVEAIINAVNCTIMFCGKDKMIFNGDGLSSVTESHKFCTGIMHCSRFFAVDYENRFKLCWSSGSALEWKNGLNGCGYAYLSPEGGEVLKLVNYDEKLIAVRERGLSVIRAYGEPQNYKIDESANYYTADGIIKDTIDVCDNSLIFCTESGIFAFDGNDIERQNLSFGGCDGDVDNPEMAVAYGDRYYVLCTSKKWVRSMIYAYEPINKLGYYVNFSPECIVAAEGVIALSGGVLYVLKEGGKGEWKRLGFDFGVSCKKYLRSVEMQTFGDVEISITCGNEKRTLSGSGVKKVGMSGYNFDFEVSGSGEVYALCATVEVVDEI
jgi:hypothetical protein